MVGMVVVLVRVVGLYDFVKSMFVTIVVVDSKDIKKQRERERMVW